jgi:hypothetical protein
MVFGAPTVFAAVAVQETQTGTADGSSTTLDMAAMNLASGSGVIACIGFEGGNSTINAITDTALNTYTLLTVLDFVNNASLHCGYTLSAIAHASNVVRFTLNAARTFRRGIAAEITHAGVLKFDVESTWTLDVTDLTPSSNAVNTTGTDEVCFAFLKDTTAQTFSSETINGVARDARVLISSDTVAWYRVLSATFSGGTSSLTRTVQPADWGQRMQCFKAVPGGVAQPIIFQ